MRQFFVSIPRDLEEAAFIDGATRWTILWRIFVPLSKPAIATLSAFSFLYAWNSFVWPLVVINSGNLDTASSRYHCRCSVGARPIRPTSSSLV